MDFGLLSLGIVSAITILLGSLAYFNNNTDYTNKVFLLFCIFTVLWGISNYLIYNLSSVSEILWALRFHLFISTWHAYVFYLLCETFSDHKNYNLQLSKRLLLPATIFVSVIVLTPVTFSKIINRAPTHQVTIPEEKIGLVLFVITILALISAGILSLVKKLNISAPEHRYQTKLFTLAMSITICLIIIFNMVLPVVFRNTDFIPLSSLFIVPFIFFISYAIAKCHLFNIRIMAIQMSIFILWLIILARTLLVDNLRDRFMTILILIVAIIFGLILLLTIPCLRNQQKIIDKLSADLKDAYRDIRRLRG